MENPRPEKVEVVEQVKARLEGSDAALLTEYRGITVAELATLRRSLSEAGGEYTVYKNTLVRIATRELGLELDDMLTGPTAIAFVPTGGGGDPVAVAKALREFAKGNPNLVVKGGLLGDKLLDAAEAKALAEVAPREELLARLAGLMAAPMQQFAGMLQALPRDFAYGLAALIDAGGAPGAPESVPVTEASADIAAPTEASAGTTDTASDDATEAPAPVAETPAEATAEAETPAEATAEAETPAEATADAETPAEATADADTPAPADAGDDTQES